MAISNVNEPMLEMYIFETGQLLDRLEQILMASEDQQDLEPTISEIFRVMHTIKGNSMMMLFEDIGTLAHAVEDLFDYVRKVKECLTDFSAMVDLVLESLDFMKQELGKIEAGQNPDGKATELVETIHAYLESLKFMNPGVEKVAIDKTVPNQKYYIPPGVTKVEEGPTETAKQAYRALIRFEEGCEMENVRAFSVVHNLKALTESLIHFPKDIVESDDAVGDIQRDGFSMFFQSAEQETTLQEFFEGVAFLKELEFQPIDMTAFIEQQEFFDTGRVAQKEIRNPQKEKEKEREKEKDREKEQDTEKAVSGGKGLGNFISVGVSKVDALMDLIGELVVSESMVVNNPDLQGLELNNFEKSARQHRMIIKELQDVIMSIRMVPLELTFQKMNRIVRDMSKKMGKDVRLEIAGADTEVDKSVIEHIGDPLMHIIRNSIDHGIEAAEDRIDHGKEPQGTVLLDARQSGGFVYITIKDDGKGLDPEGILDKAENLGLLTKPRKDYLDKEAYQFIFAPGFSTKEAVTEYSGRGVGLDVVTRNLQTIGGVVSLDSQPGEGSEFVFKIPLSLAILEGMLMQVGKSTFAVPITSIRESLSVKEQDVVRDTDGNEMIMIRGQACPIQRLHRTFGLETHTQSISEGILIQIENEQDTVLLFADAILGEQQLVVKPLSKYLKSVNGLGGCALLGDGKICLILDPAGMTRLDRRC